MAVSFTTGGELDKQMASLVDKSSLSQRTRTYLDELSPLILLSPSLTLLPCLTRCLASSGATSSLLCTLNEVSCFFLKPNRFLVPFETEAEHFGNSYGREETWNMS